MSDKGGIFKQVLTFFSFCTLCAAVPVLIFNYCVLQYCRRIWIAILSKRFPKLDFIKTHSVRSLVDSWRNPAVINVLVEIKGRCDKNLIRAAVSEHLLRRSCLLDKTCPHLRRQLTSCWGSSAWILPDDAKEQEFDVTKHVVCAPKVFRGRRVCEANIQEYVSSITKKYLPSNQPPWQIVIVPNIVSLEEKYYIVVRIHHLLLAKEHKLNIGDFLMLRPRTKRDSPQFIPISTTIQEKSNNKKPAHDKKKTKKVQKGRKLSKSNQELKILDMSYLEEPEISHKNKDKALRLPANNEEQDDEDIHLPEVDQNLAELDQANEKTIRNKDQYLSVFGEANFDSSSDTSQLSIDIPSYQQSNLNTPTNYDIFDNQAALQQLQLISEQLSKLLPEITSGYDKLSNTRFSPKDEGRFKKSPLLDVFESPTAFPELVQRINISIANLWNEFKGNYDPLEWPPKKNKNGLAGLLAVVVIVFVCICKEALSAKSGKWSIKASLEKEFTRRNINSFTIFSALSTTMNPINLIKFYCSTWIALLIWFCKIPYRLSKEFLAAATIMKNGYCGFSNTWCSTIYDFLPLVYKTGKELCYVLSVIYYAPITMLEELFSRDSKEPFHNLQTVSLCGRKVVAWSNFVETDIIKSIAIKTNVTTTEVMLSAACGALSDFFRENDVGVPSKVRATIRHVAQDFLLTPFSPDRATHRDRIGGVVCVSLPMEFTKDPEDCLKNLQAVKKSLDHSRSHQKAVYSLSLIQTKYGLVTRTLPSVLSKLAVNYLSRKFAVTFTEVGPRHDDGFNISFADEQTPLEKNGTTKGPMETRWGHEVTGVLYWRPPQANISMSITFQAYGSQMRMGVMADGQLSPSHTQIADSWCQRILHLASKTSVTCDVVLRVPEIQEPSKDEDFSKTLTE